MSRLFELKSHTYEGDVATLIDLDKVCWVKIEKKPREHYPHLMVRFVDGHEWHDLMIDQTAHQLVEAFRAYLTEQAGILTPASKPQAGNEMGLESRGPRTVRSAGRMGVGPKRMDAAPIASAVSPIHN
jgi:hypothetical protein